MLAVIYSIRIGGAWKGAFPVQVDAAGARCFRDHNMQSNTLLPYS